MAVRQNRQFRAMAGRTANWKKVAELGDKSITDNTHAHKAAIDNIGVGLYYGDHSRFHEDILRGDRQLSRVR